VLVLLMLWLLPVRIMRVGERGALLSLLPVSVPPQQQLWSFCVF